MVPWAPLKHFSLISPQMADLWPKHVCPNMDMRSIFGHCLAKYEYFWMKYDAIWLVLFAEMSDLYQKNIKVKMDKSGLISICVYA